MDRQSKPVGIGGLIYIAALIVNPLMSNAADERPRTLLLTATDGVAEIGTPGVKILVRELMRQAVLIAARDELGLATRDMALRESIEANLPDATLLVCNTQPNSSEKVKLMLFSQDGNARKIFFNDRMALVPVAPFDYRELATVAETNSRTVFVDALKQAGFTGRKNSTAPDCTPSEQTLAHIQEMTFLSQFAALRELHNLQRTKGESKYTLGALVRSYANLGVLTSFHWNAAPKVFAARSLLYAQRLLKLDDDSPFALRHRAYAFAMVGLHAAALKDLQAASEKLPADQAGVAAETPWERLIANLCRYDFAAMQKEPPPAEWMELGALIAFMIVDNSGCEHQTLVTGRDVSEISPENYFVLDSMTRYQGVSNQHAVTVIAPLTLAKTLPGRLKEMPDLPDSVLHEVAAPQAAPDDGDPSWASPAARRALIDRLAAAGTAAEDHGEPSWQTLSVLLDDLTFIHVFKRLAFFQHGLALPRESYEDEFISAVAAVEKHPYLPIVRTAVFEPKRDAAQVRSVLNNFRIPDVGWPAVAFLGRMNGIPPTQEIYNGVLRHLDDTANDLERVAERTKTKAAAHWIRFVSPHSPQAVMLLAALDEPYARPRLKEWEEQFSQYPAVQRALGKAYFSAKQVSDGVRCMERYLEISPDQQGYEMFADLLFKEKQYDKWKQVLLASLDQEDFALSHARTRVKLARFHLKRQELDQAVVYADEAASTGAAWAMLCAADCHEALGHWEEAETLMESTSRRYSDQQMDWYFWCRRTGRGRVEEAKSLALRRVQALAARSTPYDATRIATYFMLSGEHKNARAAYQAEFDKTTSVISGMHLALLCDEQGDAAARDAALEKLATPKAVEANKDIPAGEALMALSQWMAQAYKQPRDAALDIDGLEKILRRPIDPGMVNVLYFAGRFFYVHNDLDRARKFFTDCIAIDKQALWTSTIASTVLRDMPVQVEKPKESAK